MTEERKISPQGKNLQTSAQGRELPTVSAKKGASSSTGEVGGER